MSAFVSDRMKRSLILMLLLVVAAPALIAAPRRRAVGRPDAVPPCSMVMGTPGVTFTFDDGETLAPRAQRVFGVAYTYGLTVLNSPNELLAWHHDDLILSSDYGCTWRTVATFTDYDFPPKLVAAKGNRAYAWSDHREYLVRYDWRGAVKLKAPTTFTGFASDPADGDHVRAAGANILFESHDAGETWTRLGTVFGSGVVYRVAFDPSNLDHVAVAGTAIWISNDAGQTWQKSKIGADIIYEVIDSPADPNVLWAEGLSFLDDTKHIFRSTDGGAMFVPVVDESETVHLVNGALLAPHPTNRDVLYFVFGTYFQNYGTDLYRYDASTRTLSLRHNNANDINAIAFSPLRPNLMYLGLEFENGGL